MTKKTVRKLAKKSFTKRLAAKKIRPKKPRLDNATPVTTSSHQAAARPDVAAGDSSTALAVAIRSVAEALPQADADAVLRVLEEWGVSANPFQVSMILKRARQAAASDAAQGSSRRRDGMLARAKAKFVQAPIAVQAAQIDNTGIAVGC